MSLLFSQLHSSPGHQYTYIWCDNFNVLREKYICIKNIRRKIMVSYVSKDFKLLVYSTKKGIEQGGRHLGENLNFCVEKIVQMYMYYCLIQTLLSAMFCLTQAMIWISNVIWHARLSLQEAEAQAELEGEVTSLSLGSQGEVEDCRLGWLLGEVNGLFLCTLTIGVLPTCDILCTFLFLYVAPTFF